MSDKRAARPEKQRNLISSRVQQVAPSGIRKFFDLLATMDDVISLGVGEPDFVTPWRIREAAIYSIEHGDTMYTSNSGMPALRQAISRDLEQRYGVSYDPNKEIVITVGVSEGLDLAMRAILEPGEEVICPEPGYVAYSACPVLAGGVFVPVPTTIENDFKVRAEDIEARVTADTKAILLGYPNNPTGAVMPRSEMAEVAKVAERHDLLVVSDEIYAQLVYGIDHTCVASLPGMKERTILLGGFSKAYAMTGWRIGYAAGTAEIIAAMTKIHQYTMLCVPTMSQMAALEALRAGNDAVMEMVEEYDHRRRVIVAGLNHVGLPCFEPKGAFYAFPSIKGTGLSSEKFAERLLFEEKVAVVPGSAFGKAGEGYVRCCYATSLTEIEEALGRIERFVNKLK